MNIILFGAPGCGKGTQAYFISKKYNIPNISVSNILKEYVSKKKILEKKINNMINNGNLINDELVINIFKKRIQQNDCLKGFVLDGFPRTLSQAHAIKQFNIKIHYIINFVLEENIIIKRLSGRMIHVNSGRIYHKIYNPPKENNKDDYTGEKLEKRKDDDIKIIKKRILQFYKNKNLIMNFYQKEINNKKIICCNIDSSLPIKKINKKIKNILK